MPTSTNKSITRVRPRFGDVVEIVTPKGLAYCLYTHRHVEPPRWGAVIRIIPGIFREQPVNFQQLVQLPPQFITFFPLGAACNRRVMKIVASVDVPEHAEEFPTFRNNNLTPGAPGKPTIWHFWNGVRSWKQNRLIPEQEKLPTLGIVNLAMLIHWIVVGWRHEDVP